MTGCGRSDPQSRLILASTTSTEDTGLFGVLIPAFEKEHSEFKVSVIAVGTGQALELGRRRDADVVLVHAPPAESAFIAEGHASVRCEVMQNDFVIVGPVEADPAGIFGERSPVHAFTRIAATHALFVSRGDNSGTHQKELALWQHADITPAGDWYLSVGQGMAETLRFASEKKAYTLTDRASFLTTKGPGAMRVFVTGDSQLLNQYSVIPVTRAVNRRGAKAFAEWITGPNAQSLIGAFKAAGAERLFLPNAKTCAL